ncbi:MAG: HEAT repeat domain-containing protein [Tannerellaceae bacterium]|jgi:hypothetical protein|nr:HEAT repeat domain-containing protein [Tannerellaceae bacterium]
MGLFTPAWKSIDEKKAQKAVKKINNQKKLARIVAEAPTVEARKTAIEQLIPEQHQPLLAMIAKEDYDSTDWPELLRAAAFDKLTYQTFLADVAKEAKTLGIRRGAVNKLIPEQHQTLLAAIAKDDEYSWIRISAIKKLIPEQHQSLLAVLAKEDEKEHVRECAVKKLARKQHQLLLAKIAKEDKDATVRKAAVKQLYPERHQQLCAEIAKDDADWKVRQAAYFKLLKPTVKRSLIEYYSEHLQDNDRLLLAIYKRETEGDIRTMIAERDGKALHLGHANGGNKRSGE